VSGVTSNPRFLKEALQKVMTMTNHRSLARMGKSSERFYLSLTVEDIQNVADLLRRPMIGRMVGMVCQPGGVTKAGP